MSRIADWLGALLFPQRVSCHICGDSSAGGVLCEVCQSALNALRLDGRVQRKLVNGVSAYAYRGEARALVRALKYGADRTAAEPLAAGMSEAFALEASLHGCDILVYVPANPKREAERGYNQARVLCERLAEHIRLPIANGALLHVGANESQVAKNREERLANVRGAFCLGDASVIEHRRVLLIDDVLTTGATARACADALLEGGAESVDTLTACGV